MLEFTYHQPKSRLDTWWSSGQASGNFQQPSKNTTSQSRGCSSFEDSYVWGCSSFEDSSISGPIMLSSMPLHWSRELEL